MSEASPLHLLLNELYEKRKPLIDERNNLFNLLLLSFRPTQKQRLEMINKELDSIEMEIAKLFKNEWQKIVVGTEEFIKNNELLIRKYSNLKSHHEVTLCLLKNGRKPHHNIRITVCIKTF